MSDYECPNCGYKMSSNEECCKYCGSKNPNYVQKSSFSSFTHTTSSSSSSSSSSGSSSKSSSSSGGMNILVFVVLLLFFWPAAIIYAIVKSR